MGGGAVSRALEIAYLHPSELTPDARNARTHSKSQIAQLKHAIENFGFTNPILVDENGLLIAGHGRLRAAKELGLSSIPTITLTELTDAQKRMLRLADNKIALNAGWDFDLLKLELGELSALDVDIDLSLTGFSSGELDVILEDDPDPDDDVVPAAPQTPRTRPGDIWELGDHRVGCADVRDVDFLCAVVGNAKIDAAFLDPPYNVKIKGHANTTGRHREFAMASGEMGDSEFRTFLAETLGVCAQVSRNGAVHFVCIDWRHAHDLTEAGQGVYDSLLNVCIWNKSNADGKITGGGVFDRGHIHHILTNPIYAGRIRHKKQVFEGQHDATIDPERWDRIQQQLQQGAAKGRARRTARQSSRLCGRLFDETGDRLTPSHTRTKTGVRLRYYVSHRLIRNSGEQNVDGWRLPAPELEDRVAELIRQKLSNTAIIGRLLPDRSADDIRAHHSILQKLCGDNDIRNLLDLAARIDLRPGALTVTLEAAELAWMMNVDASEITQKELSITAPFQLRKRGVETKLVFGDAPTVVDETLIRNIARAHLWFEQIKAGRTLSDIAKAEGTTNGRMYQLIDLAFLAPDIIRDVLSGKQPLGFTSDWCVRHTLPANWQDQRALIATL